MRFTVPLTYIYMCSLLHAPTSFDGRGRARASAKNEVRNPNQKCISVWHLRWYMLLALIYVESMFDYVGKKTFFSTASAAVLFSIFPLNFMDGKRAWHSTAKRASRATPAEYTERNKM